MIRGAFAIQDGVDQYVIVSYQLHLAAAHLGSVLVYRLTSYQNGALILFYFLFSKFVVTNRINLISGEYVCVVNVGVTIHSLVHFVKFALEM